MTTTVTATVLPDEAAVRLRVSAMAEVPVIDFAPTSLATASDEGAQWVTSNGQTRTVTSSSIRWQSSTAPASAAVRRQITGLVVGQRYRVVAMLDTPLNTMRLVVTGIVTKTLSAPIKSGGGINTQAVTEFVATATTHELAISSTTAGSFDVTLGDYTVARVGEAPNKYESLGTTISGWTWTGANADFTRTGPAIVSAAVQTTLTLTNAANVFRTFGTLQRTLTSLVIGRRYTFTTYVTNTRSISDTAAFRVRVYVDGGSATQLTQVSGNGGWTTMTFTATATSHVVRIGPSSPYMTRGNNTLTMRLEYARLDLLPLPPVTQDRITGFTRTDANGTANVRLPEGQVLSGGVLLTTDSEAALVGPVIYTVDAVVADVPEIGTASVTFDDTTVLPRLNAAQRPGTGQPLTAVTVYRATRNTSTAVFDVIDRPTPLVSLGVQRSRSGEFEVWCPDYATARRIEELAGVGDVLHLRQPDHAAMDMYLVTTGVSTEPYAAPAPWRVVVRYIEVEHPTGPLYGIGVGWTMARALERNATLAASRSEFPTLLALADGPSA